MRLPIEYQQVKYIESSGTQYIDTGINASVGLTLCFRGRFTDISRSEQVIGKSWYDNGGFAIGYALNASTTKFLAQAGHTLIYAGNLDTNIHTFKLTINSSSQATFEVDDDKQTASITFSQSINNLVLFARRTQSSIDDYCYFQMEWAYALDSNNNKILDLVSCYRKADGVIGMYDNVSNLFKTNAGTGTFTKGADVIYNYSLVDRIISPNIWDELWENCVYREDQSGQKQANVNAIGCKNYIAVSPNTTYYFKTNALNPSIYVLYYKEDKTMISYYFGYGNRTITTPNDCKFITWYSYNSYGTTYKHDICINISNPSIDGTYYPYVMYKKYSCVDKSTVSVPIGYRSVDIKLSGNYGYVDLGSLTWTYNSALQTFYAIIIDKINNAANDGLCSKYQTITYNPDGLQDAADNLSDKQAALSKNTSNPYIYVKDSLYTDTPSLKTAMNGIYLIYKRATPSNPTIVKANDKNKYCYHNSVLGIYDSESETFRYNSNIEMSAYIKKYKIGD